MTEEARAVAMTGAVAPRTPARAALSPQVWAFIALLAVLSALVWATVLSSYGALAAPFTIPWWLLAPMVFVAESAVIHLTFRQDAHSFSLSEIVVVVALFLAHPAVLLVAQVLGNAASLLIGRRQVLVKAAFNITQLVLVTGIATMIFRSLMNGFEEFGPVAWGAAVVASVASIVVGELCIDSVIHLTGGHLTRREKTEALVFGAFGASVNAALGLLAVFVAWYDLRGVWLVAIPPTLMYVAYRVHAVQRDQHKRLESMHAVTEAIHTAPDMTRALVDAARSARKLVNATWLEIIVFPDAGDQPHQTMVHIDGSVERMTPRQLVTPPPDWWIRVVGDRQSLMTHDASRSAISGNPPIRKDAIIVPIAGAERLHGYVLAADRLGDVSAFATRDVHLLETVAKQVSISLDNGRLETSLATVTALKERLEGMVRSKDEFIASVSHELRTPLTAVVGLAEELNLNLDLFTQTDLEEFIHLIADQSNELAFIIEDLLVAARADIGTLPIHAEPVDVMDTIAKMTESGSTSPSPILVTGDCGDAWADPLRLRQVLRNLLSNASRYGGGAIGIEVKQGATHIDIAVVDHGPGIPPGREEAIFEAYERAHTKSTQPGSVGLGLAVARNLARLMGGDLSYARCESTTRFTVSVPVAKNV